MSRNDLDQLVLILAAGNSVRFDGKPKQLLDIGGETVIGRIARQVHERGAVPFIVSHHEHFRNIDYAFFVIPGEHGCTCETLYSELTVPGEPWYPERAERQVIVLLGDVVYSKALMDTIFNCKDDIRVFGNTWEIFGISFYDSIKDKVVDAAFRASKIQPGKLRTFYYQYTGLPVGTKILWNRIPEEKIFYWWNDWSNDMDSLEKYERFIAEVVNTNTLDEKP